MPRALKVAGSLVLAGALGVIVFLWARSESGTDAPTEQTNSYPASFATADRDTFTVMTYNLGLLADSANAKNESGATNQHATDVSGAIGLIEEVAPDFLGLQRVPFRRDDSDRQSLLDTLANRLGYGSTATALHSRSRGLLSVFTSSESTATGEALLSRYPIRRHLRSELPGPSGSLWRGNTDPTPLIQVSAIDVGGWPLLILNTHLSDSDPSIREQQARRVIRYYHSLAGRGFPVLLLGTFNSLMPGAGSADVPARFADQTMQILLPEGQIYPAMSSEVAKVTGGNVSTFPSNDPKWKVDYILHSPDRVVPINAEVRCGPSPPPSKHCAVTMSFLLPRPKDQLPEGRIPDEKLPSLDSLAALDTEE